jgi:hypothetical protein
MSGNASRPAARFIHVHAELLPDSVQVQGTIYAVGPVNPPDRGPGWLPGDLLAAHNVASGHLSMARRLLGLVRGLTPEQYKERAHEQKSEPAPDGKGWIFFPNELANVAYEIKCQNGAEVVTALWDQLTAANESGMLVEVGPVSEANAHAAAFAAAHQLANEVLNGESLSIEARDLEQLEQRIFEEARRAARARSKAREGESSPPSGHGGEQGSASLKARELRSPDLNREKRTPAPTTKEPQSYLYGWRNILEELRLRNNNEEKGRVSRLNKKFAGPIKLPRRGGRPVVVKHSLLDWWNGLEQRFEESRQKQANQQATGEARHAYGRDGEVAPEVAGRIKKRRGKSR